MAHVQGSGVSGVGALTFLDHTFGSNVQAGNILVVGLGTFMPAGATASGRVTDTLFSSYRIDAGTTYTAAGAGTDSVYIGIHATEPLRAGGACTVRVTPSSSQLITICVAEVSVTTKFRQSTGQRGATSAASTAVSTGAITPPKGVGYLFGFMSHDAAGSPTLTVTGSHTQIAESESSSNMPFSGSRREVTSAAAYDTTWTMGASAGGDEFFAHAAVYETPDGLRANYTDHPKPMLRLAEWLLFEL